MFMRMVPRPVSAILRPFGCFILERHAAYTLPMGLDIGMMKRDFVTREGEVAVRSERRSRKEGKGKGQTVIGRHSKSTQWQWVEREASVEC